MVLRPYALEGFEHGACIAHRSLVVPAEVHSPLLRGAQLHPDNLSEERLARVFTDLSDEVCYSSAVRDGEARLVIHMCALELGLRGLVALVEPLVRLVEHRVQLSKPFDVVHLGLEVLDELAVPLVHSKHLVVHSKHLPVLLHILAAKSVGIMHSTAHYCTLQCKSSMHMHAGSMASASRSRSRWL